MPLNRERCMEAEGAWAGGLQGRLELPLHRPVGLGSQAEAPLWLLWFFTPLPSTATSYYCPKVTKCSPGIKYY